MNWYRVRMTHDQWSARDLGRMFQAEGTIRNLMLVKAGYLEEVAELAPAPKAPAAAARAFTEPPVGSTKVRKRRGVQAEVGSGKGEDVRQESGDSARGEDSAAD